LDPPLVGGLGTAYKPSVILLPAGTIVINTGWILPDRTRIYGQGERPGASTSGTVIQAVSSFGSGNPMIQLVSSTVCPTSNGGESYVCFGLSVQDLLLDGQGQDVIGIQNENSQETGYVERVNLANITGTGLLVSTTGAQNSGPYSNIACSPGSNSTSSTTCVDINGVYLMRAVRGLTATGTTGSGQPLAAVLLDSGGVTIEDAHFEGFGTGIQIGENAIANGDVINNVTGGTGAGPLGSVITISTSTAPYAVTNLSILGVSSLGATDSIVDHLTSTTLTDSYVGAYFVGEPLSTSNSGPFTRFTTSPSAPTWGVGTSSVSGEVCSSNGSIFSNTAGGAGSTLYVCVSGHWRDVT